MKREAWLNENKNWKKYMENYFIDEILSTRLLLWSYYLLNDEIDESNRRLQKFENPTMKQLQQELDKLRIYKQRTENLNDELVKKQIMNHRPHSRKTFDTCLKIYAVNFVRNETNIKIQRLQKELDNERAEQQAKFANSQKLWLLVLNILLGSSVLFTIIDKLKTDYLLLGHFLYRILGVALSDEIIIYAEPVTLLFLGIIALVGVAGLILNFIMRQIGFDSIFAWKKKESKQYNESSIIQTEGTNKETNKSLD